MDRHEWYEAGIRAAAKLRPEPPLRVEDVCEEAGRTRMTFARDFPDGIGEFRRGLVSWWANDRYDHDLVEPGRNPLEVLKAYIFRGSGMDAGGRVLRGWATDDPELADIVRSGDENAVSQLATLVEACGVDPDDALIRAGVVWLAFLSLPSVEVVIRPEDVESLIAWLVTPSITPSALLR
jgi:hypothetical protein